MIRQRNFHGRLSRASHCHALGFFLGAIVVSAIGGGLFAQEIVVDSVLLTIAQQAEVPAREAGVLSELLVREGQTVRGGELLGKLEDEEAKLAYNRALIELERAQKLSLNDVKVRLAKKELEIAQAELRRANEATGRLNGSVTGAELDRLKFSVQRATLEVEQAEFELDHARLAVRLHENELQAATEDLRRRQIISPISGTVAIVQRHLGEWVEKGQPIARVIAAERLRAEGFLSADQVRGELIGRKTLLSVRLPALQSQRFPGTLVFVNPEVDPVNGQVRIWSEIENRDGRLRPGLSGSLTIEP